MPSPLTPGDGQDVLARLKNALERRDPDAGVALFGPTMDFWPDPFEPGLTEENAVRAWWNRMAATRAHQEFDAERTWVVGRTVLSSWHGAYTSASDGERIRLRGFLTAELDGEGLIERLRMWPLQRSVGMDGRYEVEARASAEVSDG